MVMLRGLLVLLATIALAAGCGSPLANEQRLLPKGFEHPAFILQSWDATGTLLIGGRNGVRRSNDGGRTWHLTGRAVYGARTAAFTSGSTIVSRGKLFQRGTLAYDRVSSPQRAPFDARAMTWLPGGTLYAATRGTALALHVSINSGRSWNDLPALGLPRGVAAIAAGRVDGGSDVLFAACGKDGLWRSDDGGISFARSKLAGADIGSVATTPAQWGRVVVATPEIAYSDDFGATWTRIGTNAVLVAADPRNERVFFATTDAGTVIVSRDGGRTFTDA